ncbi:dihydrofolate reductase family protein [Kineococcus sp. SYSU DK005]|uniref:dihydrofolate reductase family protein n=1 Tax=Kineococcus sp. SYSU DK005 TaxID=3383126 RepID=UPI003D7CEF78
MRKVVVYHLLSLDGVSEEPGDWMSDTGREVFDDLAAVIATQDTVLLGRGTYEYWSGYWLTSTVQPFADFINGTPKHVFASTRPSRHWHGSTFVTAPAAEHVARLKEGRGGDIGVHGSTTLARSLLQARLVDELRLVVAASLARSGRTLFDAAGGDATGGGTATPVHGLRLVQARSTPAGSLLLHYAC